MRGSGNRLRASAPHLFLTGVPIWLCLVAALLLGSAALAQEEAPAQTPPVEDASDAAESGAEDDEFGDPETEDLSSETAPTFEIDPFKNTDIEEILIHGEAGTGTPKAAPISVIGFDMDTLSKEGIRDIRDLANFTPSLEIKSAFAATNPAIFIRGVGLDDFNANAASAVAIYQDGVYLQSGAIQLAGFFDEEGVEVLRGPQGTFYRNASAGAILINSRQPTEEFEAYLSSTYGRFNQLDISGAISGPIVQDWLSARVAGYWNSRDGTTKNRCNLQVARGLYPCNERSSGGGSGTPPLLSKPLISRGVEARVNDVNNYGIRGLFLLAPPTLDMEWLVNVHGGQNLGHAYQYQHHGVKMRPADIRRIEPPQVLDPGPVGDARSYVDDDGDPYAGAYDLNGPEDLDLFGTNLKWSWNFGHAYELETITAYEWHDRFTLENSDGSPFLSSHTEYADTAWQFSQEFNLRGEWIGSDFGDGGWSLGALYLQEDLEVDNVYDAIGTAQLQKYDQKLRNFGSYIQGDYTVRPGCVRIGCDFKIDVGLRYNVEYKKFDITACPFPDRKCNENKVTITGTEDEQWNGWSGDFVFSWFYDDEENNIYLAYHRGWKGGHFNGGATSRYDIITGVDPEIVDSYEVGLRAHWFDGRLMTNVTGFYYDYQDLQVFKLEQEPTAGFVTAKLINAQSAEIYGIELDLAAQPIEGMNITFNAAWVESEYDEFVTELPFRFQPPGKNGRSPLPVTLVWFPFDYSGNDLIGSPRFSFTGSINYDIPLPGQLFGRGLGTLSPRYSFSWKDDIYFDPASGQGAYINFPESFFGQEAFWIHNASLSWRSENELIEVTGWVHNFLDEHYKTSSDDYSQGLNYVLNAWSDPRTYGITVTVSY
ncbi:MAG: TonB-dependent receptor [Deltaproteobacteria bacterium]|nr:TonB-dependent receptor [Deltaproteobacteria bacterium]